MLYTTQELHHVEHAEGKMAAIFECLSPAEVCNYLKEQIPSISHSILEKIVEHKIDGKVFLVLNNKYLWEIAPLLGDRLKVKRAISTPLSKTCSVSYVLCLLCIIIICFIYTWNFSIGFQCGLPNFNLYTFGEEDALPSKFV